MVNGSQISLALPPELDEEIHRAVQSGDYATETEVVLEALSEWKARRMTSDGARAKLQQVWAEGIASGPGRLGSMDAIKEEARRRLEKRSAQPG